MDYSLLLGLDKEKPEVVVGLVDAVGSYGLFKNIESRGKMAFNRGREGEVTIVSGHVISRNTQHATEAARSAKLMVQIPPDQYRDRFETALRQYFTVRCRAGYTWNVMR
jgi:1-phosphatidylinositol-3-phosphate 5-kinase